MKSMRWLEAMNDAQLEIREELQDKRQKAQLKF